MMRYEILEIWRHHQPWLCLPSPHRMFLLPHPAPHCSLPKPLMSQDSIWAHWGHQPLPQQHCNRAGLRLLHNLLSHNPWCAKPTSHLGLPQPEGDIWGWGYPALLLAGGGTGPALLSGEPLLLLAPAVPWYVRGVVLRSYVWGWGGHLKFCR